METTITLDMDRMNATQLARLFWVLDGDETAQERVKGFGFANCGTENFLLEIEFEMPVSETN